MSSTVLSAWFIAPVSWVTYSRRFSKSWFLMLVPIVYGVGLFADDLIGSLCLECVPAGSEENVEEIQVCLCHPLEESVRCAECDGSSHDLSPK